MLIHEATSFNIYCRSATQRDEIERRYQIVKFKFRHEDGSAPELDQVAEQKGELEQVQVPEQVRQVAQSPGECQERTNMSYRVGLVVWQLGWVD